MSGRSDLVVAELGRGFGHQVGIGGEGNVARGLGRRDLFLGNKAIALLERFHLQCVNLVDDLVEFVLQLRVDF